jgi:mitotic spindle assembly checkpoint protein MAD1
LEVINVNGDVEDEKKFRDKLLQAEQELAAAKGREQALQNQLAKEVNDNQERFKKQLESQSKLEVSSPLLFFFFVLGIFFKFLK